MPRRPNRGGLIAKLTAKPRSAMSEEIFLSPPGIPGTDGRDAGLAYSFDTSTSMADPGTGDVRFNNGTIGSVTAIAISDTDDEGNDLDAFLDGLADSTSTVKGRLEFSTADGQYIIFRVTAVTDQGTWHQVTVTHLSGTLPSNDEALKVLFVRTGDKGDTGADGSVGAPGASGGLAPCRAATTANITISTALNNGDSLDGVTLATGDRVLVKDQSSAAENGIWVVGASPARSTDADAAGELYGGATVTVQEGTINADTLWVITTNGSITPGTTAHTWALLERATKPAARAYHSANQSIGSNAAAYNALAFNSERYDNDGLHDTSTNNSRLTCTKAGLYSIKASVQWDTNATGRRIAYLRLNGSTLIAISELTTATGAYVGHSLSADYKLAAGDYVEVCVAQSSGGNLNVLAVGNYTPEFSMSYIGIG